MDQIATGIVVLEDFFHLFVEILILGLELMGAVVIVCGAVNACYGYFYRHAQGVRLSLARCMALGLEFKLGGEILRTVLAREWDDILVVGAIILLRAALTFLIHWEIKHLRHEDADEAKDGPEAARASLAAEGAGPEKP